MSMQRRQTGFSLVELSFVIIIIMILAGITAGGGSYLSNQAKAQKMSQLAKEMFAALNLMYGNTLTWTRPGDGDTTTLEAALRPYLEGRTAGTATSFLDPWTGSTKWFKAKNPSVSILQATDYGNTTGLWTLGLQTADRLIYYYQPTVPVAGQPSTWTIYDQDKSYVFRFYAVQALDAGGRAVATYVR